MPDIDGSPFETARTRLCRRSQGVFDPCTLSQSSIFAGRDERFLRALVVHFEIEVFPVGSNILQAGDVGDKMYFLNRGEVEILAGHSEKRVATLPKGVIFGEMALFGDGRRGATVRALELCDCRSIGFRSFHQILRKYPSERRFFEQLSQERQRQTQQAKRLQHTPSPALSTSHTGHARTARRSAPAQPGGTLPRPSSPRPRCASLCSNEEPQFPMGSTLSELIGGRPSPSRLAEPPLGERGRLSADSELSAATNRPSYLAESGTLAVAEPVQDESELENSLLGMSSSGSKRMSASGSHGLSSVSSATPEPSTCLQAAAASGRDLPGQDLLSLLAPAELLQQVDWKLAACAEKAKKAAEAEDSESRRLGPRAAPGAEEMPAEPAPPCSSRSAFGPVPSEAMPQEPVTTSGVLAAALRAEPRDRDGAAPAAPAVGGSAPRAVERASPSDQRSPVEPPLPKRPRPERLPSERPAMDRPPPERPPERPQAELPPPERPRGEAPEASGQAFCFRPRRLHWLELDALQGRSSSQRPSRQSAARAAARPFQAYRLPHARSARSGVCLKLIAKYSVTA
mmetsp:Transcript_111485/g.296285  ORF Transcript_111485/g.296285 Transcript_111485/m.296285 type:complete len:571 (-) Transcript_111485:114-1826(-)